MCGTMTRSCDDTEHWVDGACEGEDECMTGAAMTTSCGVCGTQENTCDEACHWQPTGTCAGAVTCDPRPSSTCVDTMTLRTFGAAACMSGACDYPATDSTCIAGCSEGACISGATLLDGLGGDTGYGPDTIGASDDGSSAAIDLTPLAPTGFQYYGADYTVVFVNTNGNLSFGAINGSYTPVIPGDVPLIAGLWADVDTTGGGQPAHNDVLWFTDATRLIATWHLVGHYPHANDLENSFQIVLTARPDRAAGDFDVELRYGQCQWHGTTTSGPAAARRVPRAPDHPSIRMAGSPHERPSGG